MKVIEAGEELTTVGMLRLATGDSLLVCNDKGSFSVQCSFVFYLCFIFVFVLGLKSY